MTAKQVLRQHLHGLSDEQFENDIQHFPLCEVLFAMERYRYLDRVAPVGEGKTVQEYWRDFSDKFYHQSSVSKDDFIDAMEQYASAQVQQNVAEMERWIPVGGETEIPNGNWQFYLEKPIGGVSIHSGNKNDKFTTIAGMFSWDLPPITHYKPLPPHPKH